MAFEWQDNQVEACVGTSLSERVGLSRSPSDDFDPLEWSFADWVNYGERYLLPSSAVSVALFAVVAATFLTILFWRLVSLCWCGHSPPAKDPYQTLTSRWSKVEKGVVATFAILTIAAAVTGMVLVDKNPVKEIRIIAHSTLDYADAVVDSIDTLLNKAYGILTPLTHVDEILLTEVNVQSLTRNLRCTQSQIDVLPSPSQLKAQFSSLDSAVSIDLRTLVNALHDDIGSTVSRLLQDGSLFQNASALFLNAAGSVITDLIQTQISNTLNDLSRAIQDIQDLQSSGSLSAVANRADQMNLVVERATQRLIPPLQKGLLNLDSLCVSVQGGCLRSVLDTLYFINTSILVLPTSVTEGLGSLLEAEDGAQALCSTQGSSLGGMALIDELVNQLTRLQDKFTASTDAISAARNSISQANSYLTYLDQSQLLANIQSEIQGLRRSLSNGDTSYLFRLRLNSFGNGINQMRYSYGFDSIINDVSSKIPALKEVLDEVDRQLSPPPVGSYPADVQVYLDALDSLSVLDTLPQPRSRILDKPIQEVQQLDLSSRESIDSVRNSVLSAVRSFSRSMLDDVHEYVQDTRDMEIKYVGRGEEYYGKYGWQAWLGVYSALIALVLLLVLFTFLNCPGGLITLLLLTLGFLVFYMIVPIGLLGGQILTQDTCAHTEAIALREATQDEAAFQLVQFYLFKARDLNSVLRDADLVDVNQVEHALDEAQVIIRSIVGDWKAGEKIAGVVGELSEAVEAVRSQLRLVIAMGSFEEIHGRYVALKASVCCNTEEYTFTQYMCMTVSGMLCWALAVAACFVMRRLDKMPKLSRCGCMRYQPDDFWIPPRPGGPSATTQPAVISQQPASAASPPSALWIEMPGVCTQVARGLGAGATTAAVPPATEWAVAAKPKAGIDKTASGASTSAAGSSSMGTITSCEGLSSEGGGPSGSSEGSGASGSPANPTGANVWAQAAPAMVQPQLAIAGLDNSSGAEGQVPAGYSSAAWAAADPSAPTARAMSGVLLWSSGGSGDQGAVGRGQDMSMPRRSGSVPNLGPFRPPEQYH